MCFILPKEQKFKFLRNASFISEQIDGFSTAVARNPVLIVGIDPKKKHAWSDLDKSVSTTNKSRYFKSTDRLESDAANNRNIIPILVNPNSLTKEYDYDIERLDAPYQTEQDQQKLIDKSSNHNQNGLLSILLLPLIR